MIVRGLVISALMIGGLSAPVFADDLYEYGAYLAGECTGCHLLSDDMVGSIPSIIGMDEEYFIEAMGDYAAGFRENQAMVSVAKVLGDEEIASLARFFAKQVAPEAEEASEDPQTSE